MSLQREIIAAEDMSSASRENFTVQVAQDRLKRNKSRRVFGCILIFVFVFLIIAGIATGVIVHLVNKKDDADPGLANSKLFDYMDTRYDPCENFYEYSCGRWRNDHPNKPVWGTSRDLQLDNFNKLAGYLSQNPSSSDPNAIKKAKYIYSACTDTDHIGYNYKDQLERFMVNKGRGWENGDFIPAQSWSINDLYKDHYYGSSAFFRFGIIPDDLDSSKQVIRVIYHLCVCDSYHDVEWVSIMYVLVLCDIEDICSYHIP